MNSPHIISVKPVLVYLVSSKVNEGFSKKGVMGQKSLCQSTLTIHIEKVSNLWPEYRIFWILFDLNPFGIRSVCLCVPGVNEAPWVNSN